ncbi:hypothetical protein LIA77_11421 [Sarocladium implicatum]|nr:hypothetical protein LIA77_11421 [Sarocladium implicatum]
MSFRSYDPPSSSEPLSPRKPPSDDHAGESSDLREGQLTTGRVSLVPVIPMTSWEPPADEHSGKVSRPRSKPLTSWKPSSHGPAGRSSDLSFSLPPKSPNKDASSPANDEVEDLQVCKQPCANHEHPRQCWYAFEADSDTMRFSGYTHFMTTFNCYWIPFREGENLVMIIKAVEKDGEPTDEDPLFEEITHFGWPMDPLRRPEDGENTDTVIRFTFPVLVFRHESEGHKWLMKFTFKSWGRGESRTLPCSKYLEYVVPGDEEEDKPMMTLEAYNQRDVTQIKGDQYTVVETPQDILPLE